MHLPAIMPISAMRKRQQDVIAQMKERPVVLTQHGEAFAVLVSPQQWEELIERLEFLEDSLDAIEIKRQIEAGEEPVKDWAEIEAELNDVPA
ncbi:MAG: type II toxin-antitoxin system Phd/YefM family antitoxin [Anaerolineae bacterium]|nr:type II toxin-antitoxin system Phd/YefM family antitoxin [Anaerolineae bacterium]